MEYEKLDEYQFKIEYNKQKLRELEYKLFNQTSTIQEAFKIKKSILSLENKIELLSTLSDKFDEIKKDKLKFQILKNTIETFQKRVKLRLYFMEFKTGSYVKCAVFNKKSKKPTKHSYYFTDEDKKLYKHWYKFKQNYGEIVIPLSFNDKYHNEEFNLDKEHYVSYKLGKLNIGLSYEAPEIVYKTANLEDVNTKIIGFDLNVRDNFLSWFDGENSG